MYSTLLTALMYCTVFAGSSAPFGPVCACPKISHGRAVGYFHRVDRVFWSFISRLPPAPRMSVMTASSSKIRKQPHDVPLPTSPERVVPPAKLGKKRRSGKEKEPEPKAPSPRRADALEGEWDHAKAATKPWQWVSLTDSSTSKHPPIFTKDGK